ncbi:hypothetical protein GSI_04383 [Ganoderma sinense ZZ0214-1]|uniref:Uncharacterized protein n=1 Tax=Ganoderma sinense ZZ0214-1 TaxID=1077348 RepID=A0A2G8SJM9_9APHY|nr:hypothetical protein GSI_04383 [Ganoderma sinense ZZ0214-1]
MPTDSDTGFQGSNFVGNGEQLYRFPPATDFNFNFMNPLQDGDLFMSVAHPQNMGLGMSNFQPVFDPLAMSASGGGPTSLIGELNNLTLQGGPDPLSAVSPVQSNNLHGGAPYAFTQGQLLPVNNGFRVDPAPPGQDRSSISNGGIDASTSGNPQATQPSPIFNHADVVTRLAAAEAKVQEIEHQMAAGLKKRRSPVQLEPSIRDELHKTCTDMIGCFEKIRLTEDPDEPPYFDLPEPLAVGVPDRTAPDGTGILFNPRWNEKVTSSYNNRYIEAIVDVMTTTKRHLLNPAKHTRDVLKSAAQEYLRSLKRARSFRLNLEGRTRLEQRRQMARQWNRRRVKAYELRKAAIVLRKVVGHDQSVGLDSLVDTDWVSSEYSDAAECLEIRPVEWHSEKLQALYASLRTIRAALPRGKTLDGISLVANPQDDGKDFTDKQRVHFLRIVSANVELRKLRASNQRKRFIGSSDVRMRTKAITKGKIYQDCVSEQWAATHLSPDAAEFTQTPRPAHVTIWDAVLPQQLVDAKVRE